MKQNKLLIVGMLVLPILLSACGGAGGSSTAKTEVVNGITVPTAPDPTLNAATLIGVDSNSNGVRDDVERKIAVNIAAGDAQAYSKALAIAVIKTSIATQPTPNTRADAIAILKNEACAYDKNGNLSKDLTSIGGVNSMSDAIYNTQMRHEKLQKFNELISGASGEELLCE